MNECFERKVIYLPVRQAVAARVVADQVILAGEGVKERAPDRALPIILEVTEVICRFQQCRTRPNFGVRDANAIRRRTEMHILAMRRADACRCSRFPRCRLGSGALSNLIDEAKALARRPCESNVARRRCRRLPFARH